MFKSKIFNSVMRYMLVAMLALLPNTIWGLTEITKYALLDNGSLKVAVDGVIPSGNYSLWYIENSAGEKVEINYNCWAGALNGNVLVVNNNINSWDKVEISAKDGNTANYHLVVMTSSDEKLKQLDTSVAEKKITFKFVSQNDAPLLKEYTGTNKMSVTDFVADGSTSYDISGLASSIESLLALPSSSDGNSFDLSSKKLYLRLNLVNKTTNKVVEAANYTVKRNGMEINTPTMTNWPNVDCKTNKGTFFYLTNNGSNITKDNIKYTFSVPDGQKISDYKIDVYLSDEAADVSNNTLLQEPTLKAKIAYNLMPQSEKDKLTFDATDDSSLDASKVFNFRQAFFLKTANVQLLTEENKQRLCKALGVSDLSKVTDLYVRWMITDKSGNAIPGITASGLTLRKDKTTEKEIYYTWFSENAASTLSAALNPTFTFPTEMSWDDLKVSCVVSNTKLEEGTNVKYGVMIKEPDAFNIKFNVSLEEAPLLNDLDAAYSAKLKTIPLYLKESTIASKQLVITDIASQIKDFSLYTKDASGNYEASATKPIYYRVSIIDKKTNKPISSINYFTVSETGGISGGFTSLSFEWENKYKNSKGLFYYSKDKTSVPKSDLYIAFGFNNETDFKNSRIEVYFSDEAPVLDNFLVVTEPTIKGKLVYDIKSATDAPFKHYKGYANADNDYEVIDASKNQLRQKVSTWEYTYVVDNTDHKTVSLMLPIQNFESSGDQLEPLGYFRWYNYDTDNASANLSVEGSSSLLNSVKDADNVDKGLMAFNLMQHAIQSTVGVKYTRPSDPNWKGETIACDVSRYIDGIDATGTYMEHEPTLSIRYIFHIIPSTQMADILQEDLINDSKDLTFEDNKNVTVGFKDDNSKMTLRLDFVDPTMYYFYPVTNTNKHVYYPAGSTEAETNAIIAQRKITEADFSSDIKKAATIEWRAYNGTRDKMCILGPGNVFGFPRFFDLSISLLNGATWTNLDGGTTTKPTFNPGDHFYVVAYVKDGTGKFSSPMANFSIRYFRFYPKTFEEMGAEDVTRQISYLDENYNNIAVISFDNDSPEQTLSAPTSPDDNQSKNPSAWNRRSYGFVYKDLIDKSANKNDTGNVYYNTKHSPQHGEYGIYKTANIENISGAGKNGTDGYVWYSDKELHDRTYALTGKSQSGSFLYVDASDESRTIASAEFTASLCTGQQMAFSACIADMTYEDVKPQIMFRLFGLEKDEFGNIKDKKLLHSFSSGAFGTNRLSSDEAKWYQVYGKITIQQEAQVEKYSDFRIEIDNYSKGTKGADYAVDDIRIYLKPAKVEIYQDRPACGETGTGSIKLKIRAIHETLNAILNHKDTKIHYRLVNEDGSPVTGEGLYNYSLKGPGDATAKEITTNKSYASVDVFDSEETCAKYEIDGVNMIEKDADGETYIILANHPFKLTKGKKYYVSICADSDPDAPNANWGKPSDVCSIYSAIFEMIGQTPMITDTDGKVITEYRVNCTDSDPKVTLKGSLTTIDPNTGEKITLTGVPFLWYIDDSSTPVDATPSTTIEIPVSKIGYGAHKIYMKPETGTKNADGDMVFTVNGVEYLMCTEKIAVPLRIAKDGPQLNFGFKDVDYPFKDNSYEASLRIGLPQIKKLLEKTSQEGYLQVPLHSASYKTGVTDKTLTFIDDSKTGADNTSVDVYVATTNDPLWDASLLKKPVATLSSKTLPEIVAGIQSTLDLKFSDDVLNNFHEGYYYELRFVFEQGAASAGTTSCPGESYLKLKIVPEFITWTPTADGGMNANWNNDNNWHRSSSDELHDKTYTDYLAYGSSMSGTPTSAKDIPTLNSYVPMKFTKVTIGNLKNGLPFPDLGNIVYRSTNFIATKLTNGKGNEATKYIQYDIMAFWNEADTDKGLDTDGNLKCEKFYGNTCHQIYFKPQGELRDQCYLVYDKAWVEKELVPNKWYTMASPLQYIYAGDMYVPASNGRQETKAFTDIKFTDKTADGKAYAYSRSKYPVYQRAWMKSGVEEITPESYPASHYPEGAKTDDMNLNLGYWSHVYNKVDECYTGGSFGGFAIKAGNALLPKRPTDGTPLPNAILRLPKEDTSYQYFDFDGATTSGGKESDVKKPDASAIVSSAQNSTGHGKLLVAFNNDEKHLAEMTQNLTDNNSGFYLVANPYTCSISLKKFFEVNTGLQNAVWLIEGDAVRSVSSKDLSSKDFVIQPTQSFFVKKNGTASVDAVKFTSAMYVDRLLSTGFVIASDYLKDVNVSAQNAKGQTSKARIAVRKEASDDYDEQEDVDLLCDQNLSGIPQVYTVAGSQAVAVNATPKIEWMPMGVIMENGEKNEMVNLDFKGVAKLDAPLYLYDAANGQYTELQDGNEVSIQANEHGRYFLTQTRGTTGIQQIEAEAESNQLKVYSPAAGMIVVSALNGEKLGRVEVFTLDGKRVHSYQLPDKQRMILRVPSGVYIVKASTQSCAQAKGQKVAVR